MPDIGRFVRTVRFLKRPQVLYQVVYRIRKPVFKQISAPEGSRGGFFTAWTVKPTSWSDGDKMVFLNLEGPANWNYLVHGMLWAYNMNYMDWLHQDGFDCRKRMEWMIRFISNLPANKIGLDPYPIALRSINWIKALSIDDRIPKAERKKIEDSLWSQIKLLERKLEYHLMGNHLLEDAFALFIASVYFQDKTLMRRACKLLCGELDEQILADGGHYEQSPMYQCVLLDRLLDCYNIALGNVDFVAKEVTVTLRDHSLSMLSWLQAIAYQDGSIPLLNDSARGIAPSPKELFDYARRLGLTWNEGRLKQCGYRKMQSLRMEAIIDVGNITASYQPGHSHADTFNFELRIGGKPFIVDTGISTYNKNDRRQYERSTKAHNTVVVKGQDSSEVWGGFRVGRRAIVNLRIDENNRIKAVHDGFGKDKLHERVFQLDGGMWTVEDSINNDIEATNYIHFDSGLEPKVEGNIVYCGDVKITFEGAERIELKNDYVSSEYNHLRPAMYLEVKFMKNMKYSIYIAE